jgi:hypothetical protein
MPNSDAPISAPARGRLLRDSIFVRGIPRNAVVLHCTSLRRPRRSARGSGLGTRPKEGAQGIAALLCTRGPIGAGVFLIFVPAGLLKAGQDFMITPSSATPQTSTFASSPARTGWALAQIGSETGAMKRSERGVAKLRLLANTVDYSVAGSSVRCETPRCRDGAVTP